MEKLFREKKTSPLLKTQEKDFHICYKFVELIYKWSILSAVTKTNVTNCMLTNKSHSQASAKLTIMNVAKCIHLPIEAIARQVPN